MTAPSKLIDEIQMSELSEVELSLDAPEEGGCLVEGVIALASLGFLVLAWLISTQICLYYNKTLLGLGLGVFLLPITMQTGVLTASFAMVFQVGWRAVRITARLFWRVLFALPRRLLPGRSRSKTVPDEVESLFDDLKWWPVILGYLCGALAVCALAAYLLQFGATDPSIGFWERFALVGGYHAVVGLILTLLGFQANV